MNPAVRHDDIRFLELLKRWQSGDFTRADEQELNALTASDDFRREVLEGYMSVPEAEHDKRLATLHLRLLERDKPERRRGLAPPQVWAAAAALALLLAALWFFPRFSRQDMVPIAQTQSEPPNPSSVNGTTFPSETPGNEHLASKSPALKPTPPVAGPTDRAEQDAMQPAAPPEATDLAAGAPASAQENTGQASYAAPPEPPGAAAAVRAIQEESGAKVEAREARDDEDAGAPASAPREMTKAKKSIPARRAADSAGYETDSKTVGKEALPKQTEPAGGWESFNEYLRQNARLTPEARNNNASGTVKLQFTVNAKGDPVGFVVLHSVGYGCDEEAIRLVQNRKWQQGANPVAIVEVPFVR